MRILLVEDDTRVSGAAGRLFLDAGHDVTIEADAEAGLRAFEDAPVDLIVLDVRLPGMAGGGLALCRRIRAQSADVSILMLTAVGSRATVVQCFDAGADDYLIKPFHLEELLARAADLLRRVPASLQPRVTVGSLTLDPSRRCVERSGRVIPLSPKEFAVLDYLMRHPDAVVTSDDLIDNAWDPNYVGYSNVVPTYISYLRRKLALPGEHDPIITHRGAGYSVSTLAS